MKLKYVVDKLYYENVKQVLKEEFQISDRLLLKLKSGNKIYKNGDIVFVNEKIVLEDVVEVVIDFDEDSSNVVPTKMDISILYEDDALLVIDKPSNLAIHPSMGYYENSLSNGVRYYFDEIGLKKKIRPVNRLDRNTSGIVIFAKNEYVQESLAKQMKNNTFKKKYMAVVQGILQEKNATISAPIGRKEGSIIERQVHESGDHAVTHYIVEKENEDTSLLYILLETGRTHQIRVHMSYIGHPILGDSLYGKESTLINRQALHAYKVSFIHPITKQEMEIISPIPNDIKNLV